MTITSPSLLLFQEALKSNPSLLMEGLWDCPKAYLLAIAKNHLNQHLVIITGGERENLLYEDLCYFLEKPPLQFPAWETLPGEEIVPSPDIVGKRYQIIHELLTEKEPKVILTSLQALLQKVVPKESLLQNFLHIKIGDEVSFSNVPDLLVSLGYTKRPVASDKGEFAVRGGLIDIFPTSAFDPCRIDFFGDTIDNIRAFDPISQKSMEKRKDVFISPADEFNRLKKEKAPALFLDYLNSKPLLVFDDLLKIEDKYVSLKSLPGASSPLFLSFPDFFAQIKTHKTLFFSKDPLEALSEIAPKPGPRKPIEPISFDMFSQTIETKRLRHSFIKPSSYFEEDLLLSMEREAKSFSLTFLTASEAEENALKEKTAELDLSHAKYKPGYLSSGYVLLDQKEILLPYTEITKRQKVSRQKWRNTYHTPASDFHALTPGDLVVHFHSGIGKFLGIEKQKNHLGNEEEFFLIEYASNSKLFTPLAQSHLVSRYIGPHEETPKLHTLGTKVWQKAKEKAETAILGYAKDLLQAQANREHKGGFEYAQDSDDVELFENEFPFVETDDQLNATVDLKKDMCSLKAMDRLICGDVGYGKTEVAMRAAFKAV
ncbi:MAG: transcription-repair coupling factor, partial [Simkaniaceae bacterium]|nr:transcription-repair coupling factor [Simkaniaceae bacterium]